MERKSGNNFSILQKPLSEMNKEIINYQSFKENKDKEQSNEKSKFIENIYLKLNNKFHELIKEKDFRLEKFYNEYINEFDNIFDLNKENYRKIYQKIENIFVDKYNLGTKNLSIKKFSGQNISNNKTINQNKISQSVLPSIKKKNLYFDEEVIDKSINKIHNSSIKSIEMKKELFRNKINKSISVLPKSMHRSSSNKNGYIKLNDRYPLIKKEDDNQHKILRTDINEILENKSYKEVYNVKQKKTELPKKLQIINNDNPFKKIENVKLNYINRKNPKNINEIKFNDNYIADGFRRKVSSNNENISIYKHKNDSKDKTSKSLIIKSQGSPKIDRKINENEQKLNSPKNLDKNKEISKMRLSLRVTHKNKINEEEIYIKKEKKDDSNGANQVNKFFKPESNNVVKTPTYIKSNYISNFWHNQNNDYKKNDKLLLQLKLKQNEDPWAKIIKTDVSQYEKEEEEKKNLNRKNKIEFYNRLKFQVEEKQKINDFNKDLKNKFSIAMKNSALEEDELNRIKELELKQKQKEEGQALIRLNEGKLIIIEVLI